MRRQLSFFNFEHWFHLARGRDGWIVSATVAAKEQALHRVTAEGELRKEASASDAKRRQHFLLHRRPNKTDTLEDLYLSSPTVM